MTAHPKPLDTLSQPAGGGNRIQIHPSRKLRFPAFLFPPPAPEIHAGVLDKRGLAEQLFQGGAFFFREPLIFELERLAEQLRKLLHPVPRRLHGLLDFPDQLIGGRGIRGAFAVILMGFANVLQNGVPCFVRHMAEKIFLLYLSGFQDFQIAVVRRLRDGLPVS